MTYYIGKDMTAKLIENTVNLAVRNYRKKARKEKKRLQDDLAEMVLKYEIQKRSNSMLAVEIVRYDNALEEANSKLDAERQTVQQYAYYLMEADKSLQQTDQELAVAEDDKTWLNNKLTALEYKVVEDDKIFLDTMRRAETAEKYIDSFRTVANKALNVATDMTKVANDAINM
jgi:hypothetical protein